MPRHSQIRPALIVLLAIGFAYAGAATARRYIAISRSPAARSASSSIDAHLATAGIAGADALRRGVADAGWQPGDEVVVLARASAVTPAELNRIVYATGYLLYPSRVRVGAWCDADAAPAQCTALEAHSPEAAVARHGARRLLVLGGQNPFPSAQWAPLSGTAALVSLP